MCALDQVPTFFYLFFQFPYLSGFDVLLIEFIIVSATFLATLIQLQTLIVILNMCNFL